MAGKRFEKKKPGGTLIRDPRIVKKTVILFMIFAARRKQVLFTII